MCQRVSIIIPTLNEEEHIDRLLRHLAGIFPDTEIIIADGGSTDGTLAAIDGRAKVISATQGRARQMNTGARIATGSILWFLHADSFPSRQSLNLIREVCRDGAVVGGGFRWTLTGTKWYYGPITAVAHVKNKIKRNLYGDMGIFVRATVFRAMNGYVEIPLMEDVELNNRLRTMGNLVILDEPLITSDRRLLIRGPLFTFIRNNVIKIAYSLGVPPKFLNRFY